MIVLIDLDSTIVDLLTPWLQIHNEDHGDDLTIDLCTSFALHRHTKTGGKEIYSILERPGFFEGLQPYPGAIEAVKALHEAGHRVYIVTSCEVPEGAKGKQIWFAKHLPFLSSKRLWIGSDKFLLAGDVLIDDGPHNAEEFRAAHPNAHILGIGFPYNADCKAFSLRAGSWKDPAAAWNEMKNYVLQVGSGRTAAGLASDSFWGHVFTPQTTCSKHGTKLVKVMGYLTCPTCVPAKS